MHDRKTLILAIELRERIAKRNHQGFVDFPYEMVGKVLNLLKEQEPVPYEMEGGGSNWYPVCGECHGVISDQDSFCRHCGTPVKQNVK